MYNIKDVAVQGSRNDSLVRFEELKATSNTKIKRKRKKKKIIGKSCSAQLVKIIERMIQTKPDITEKEVFNSLKTNNTHKLYVGKGKIAKQSFRQDFRRIKFNLTKGKIPKPPNRVVKVKYSNNISKELMATKEVFKAYPITDRIEISLALMEELYLSGKKSILNFPCASGKTTAAIMLAATYASSENRMWIVTQKVEDVCRIANNLKVLGANAVEWHGRPNDCDKSRKKFMAEKASDICGPCKSKCTAHYKYLSESPWDNEDFDILVTTHSHWQAAVASNKFGNNVNFVIVDESPCLMEYYTIDNEVMESILSIFQYNNELASDFKTEMRFIQGTLSDGTCHRIPTLLSIRKSKEIQRCIYKLFQNGKLPAEVFEKVKSFINFFKTEEIYGMTEIYKGNFTMSFIRGEVDLETKIPHMVLDGSALMNDVLWKDFTIYECNDLKQAYPNTTIDVIDGNPSKAFLRDKENFNTLLRMTIDSIKKHPHILKVKDPAVNEDKHPVVIFRNKELDNDKDLQDNISQLQEQLNGMGVKLLNMCRGEHIGSNKGQKAVLCAIAMSLFKTISHYVLRTALVTHSEIPAKRIWINKFNTPKMKRNGGFADFDIQQTYCRSVVVDLYQTIMRGCVRVNPESHYNVVCVLSGPEIISILKRELPGADFNFELDPIVSALLAGKSDTEIKDEYNIKRTRLENLKDSLNFS